MTGHRRLYEERLVKEIMISTALCIQELLLDDPDAGEDEICEFVEANYSSIIEETIAAEMESAKEDGNPASDGPEENPPA